MPALPAAPPAPPDAVPKTWLGRLRLRRRAKPRPPADATTILAAMVLMAGAGYLLGWLVELHFGYGPARRFPAIYMIDSQPWPWVPPGTIPPVNALVGAWLGYRSALKRGRLRLVRTIGLMLVLQVTPYIIGHHGAMFMDLGLVYRVRGAHLFLATFSHFTAGISHAQLLMSIEPLFTLVKTVLLTLIAVGLSRLVRRLSSTPA